MQLLDSEWKLCVVCTGRSKTDHDQPDFRIGEVHLRLQCSGGSTEPTLTFGANPSAMIDRCWWVRQDHRHGHSSIRRLQQRHRLDLFRIAPDSELLVRSRVRYSRQRAAQSVLTISAAPAVRSEQRCGGGSDSLPFGCSASGLVGVTADRQGTSASGSLPSWELVSLAAMIVASSSCGGQATSSVAEPGGSAQQLSRDHQRKFRFRSSFHDRYRHRSVMTSRRVRSTKYAEWRNGAPNSENSVS